MKTALTLVFVAVACLVAGALAAHIGATANFGNRLGRVEAQRDKAIGLTEKCVGQLNDLERVALECIGKLRAAGKDAVQCCDAAEKALDERDACRKGKR